MQNQPLLVEKLDAVSLAKAKNPDAIEALARTLELSEEEVEARLDQIIQEYGYEDVQQATEVLAHEIPSAEGLSRSEARHLLVDEMNFLVQVANRKRLRLGLPMSAPLRYRAVERAVFMARQRTGYDEILEAAGYRSSNKVAA